MAKRKLTFLSVLLILFAVQLSVGQDTSTTSVADSINNRFRSLISTSNNFKQYKVVKAAKLESLRKITHGEVAALEEKINGLNNQLKEQKVQLNTLKKELSDSNDQLKAAIEAKDQLYFWGIPTQKSTYNTIVGLVILLLSAGFMTFIYKFRSSNLITREARSDLEKKEEEFDIYKKKALETQQKLGRQIIDERNKKVSHTANV